MDGWILPRSNQSMHRHHRGRWGMSGYAYINYMGAFDPQVMLMDIPNKTYDVLQPDIYDCRSHRCVDMSHLLPSSLRI